MPSVVRVSSVGDSHAMGRGRLKLKLAAIAYVNSRHGVDADVVLSRAGLSLLYNAAIDYYEALTSTDLRKRLTDPHHLQLDNTKLNLAAIAYVNARHGVDADAGLSRAGLALLCNASIEYCESLMGGQSKKRPVDPHLQLDNGA